MDEGVFQIAIIEMKITKTSPFFPFILKQVWGGRLGVILLSYFLGASMRE